MSRVRLRHPPRKQGSLSASICESPALINSAGSAYDRGHVLTSSKGSAVVPDLATANKALVEHAGSQGVPGCGTYLLRYLLYAARTRMKVCEG